MKYIPNIMCKRLVDVDLLKSLEGQTFNSFAQLCRILGWTTHRLGGRTADLDKKRLAHFCDLEFKKGSNRVTIAKVY